MILKYKSILIVAIFWFSTTAADGQDIPYLSDEYYEYNMDYTFKAKPPDENKFNPDGTKKLTTTDVLPHVAMSFLFKDVPPGAYRVRIEDNRSNVLRNRKLKKGLKLVLDLGFAVDLKDQVAPNEYYILVQNKDKESISRIVIRFDPTGDFYLNDELYGKI